MMARQREKWEDGQGIVELSIAMPLLLLILLGTIDMGRVFFDYIEMRQAAIEGATYGTRKPSDLTGIEAVMQAHGMSDDATVAVSADSSCATPGGVGDIRVTASRVWTPISLGALELVGGNAPWSFTVNAPSTQFAGLADQTANAPKTAGSWFTYLTSGTPGATLTTVSGASGCEVSTVAPYNCVMLLPIAKSGVHPGDGSKLYVVGFAAFQITQVNSTTYNATLLDDYIITGTGGDS